MRTSMKVIIAAIGVAVLASPVMAQQSESHRHASSASIARAQASVVRAHAEEVAQRKPAENGQFYSDECKYNIYKQCGYAN